MFYGINKGMNPCLPSMVSGIQKNACLLFLLAFFGLCLSPLNYAATPKNTQTQTIEVDLFLSSKCPHCKSAEDFFKRLAVQHSWLKVRYYFINENREDLKAFYHRQTDEKVKSFAVPTVFFCDARWIGFGNKANSGVILTKALQLCHQTLKKEGRLLPETKEALKAMGDASQYVAANEVTSTVSEFLFYAALTDAFSTCSFFLFALFLSGYWLYAKQLKKQIIFGLSFLLVLGVTHFFNQAYLTDYYQFKTWLRVPAAFIGAGALLFASIYFIRMRQGRRVKSWGLFFLLPTVMITYIYQQTCAFNAGVVFEEWMKRQTSETSYSLIVYAVYQAVYLLPMFVLLVTSLLISMYRRHRPVNQGLLVASLIMILTLGLLLLIQPALLNQPGLSSVVILLALMLGWVFKKYSRILSIEF